MLFVNVALKSDLLKQLTHLFFNCRIAGIHITAVTVGEKPTFEILGIASDPDSSNVIVVENFSDLPSVKTSLVQALCDGTLQLCS